MEEGDLLDITSFVNQSVCKLDIRMRVMTNSGANIVDGIWVRRWIDRRNLKLKCRLVARGYLDKQRIEIDRHSSTASHLSHRLALSQAVQHDLVIEAIDISTAFLQGLRFTEVAATITVRA